MDPLSIATGSASLVVVCVQISATLYTWIDDTRQVDTNVAALCEEILALSRVLDAISKTWKRNPQIANTQNDDGALWVSVKASIDDCKATLDKMSLLLDDIQKGGLMGRGFLRRPTKQIKFGLKTKDISVYKQRVQSYNNAMQSALHMINLCLLLQSNSSQESVFKTLSDLKSQIGRVEGALTSRDDLQISRDDREENERISRNLHRLVHAAEAFHSSASTVASGRSTVWEGSVLGDPLTQDQLSNIERWIPPPHIVEEDEQGEENTSSTGLSASTSDSFAKRNSTADTDLTSVQPDILESDSDSDIEKDITKKFQELAVMKLEERDYEKAEQFFQKVIERSETDGQPPQNMTVLKVKLAFTYCFQGKWEEAEGIIVPIAMGKQKVDVAAFHGLHTLALLHFGTNDLGTAEKYCKRALMGKKKLLGKDHASYFESINLLSVIYLKRGDQAESEVYRSFLPTGHTNELPNSPLDYLYKAMSGKKTATSRQAPLLVTPPIESPPPLPTPSPSSELTAFSPPPERSQKTWRRIFGPSSSGPRMPEISTNTRFQQPITQHYGGSYAPPQLPAIAPQYYPPAASYLSTQEATMEPISRDTRPAYHSADRGQLIIGIDFGTHDSGVAFAIFSKTDAKEDIITEWPGSSKQYRPRIPSVLYYDQTQKVIGYGADIADALQPSGYPKPGVQKVEWFKLHLVTRGEDSYVDPIKLPPLPPGKTEVDVVADYLSKIREVTRLQLQKTLGGEVFNREEQNILYYLTVPTIFDEVSKAALRAAVIQAGYLQDEDDDRLTFVEEPIALAMYCAKTGLLNLKRHDAFIVADCGGATVDVSSLEVETEYPFNATHITAATGDSCGSTALNRNFSNVIRNKIRKMNLPDGSKTAGRVYAKGIVDFDSRIKSDFRNNGQKWAVDVGIEAEFPEADIEEGYMVFNNEEILICFEPVVDRILELIRNQIFAVQRQNKQLQNILITGVFGGSEYLFQQIKLHVPHAFQTKVVRPMHSTTATVRGAVAYGIASRISSSKIVRCHYLVDLLQPFKPGQHPDYYCVSWLDGTLRCKYTYKTVFAKGEQVMLGELIKVHVEKLVAPGESLIFEDKIYTSDATDCPSFVIDPRIRLVETCTTDLSRRKPELDFEISHNANGTFYVIQYDIYFNPQRSKMAVEAVFRGDIVGTCSIPF